MIQFCGTIVTASPLEFILMVILMAFHTAEKCRTAYIHFNEGRTAEGTRKLFNTPKPEPQNKICAHSLGGNHFLILLPPCP